MTTNVPQDVIDDTNEAYKRVTGATDLQLATHVYEIANVLCQLRAQRQQGAEPVADDDSQMLVRHALGCLLEALKSSDREARLNNMDATKIVGEAIDFLKSYTKPPQPTLDFAAGMMKAAEICTQQDGFEPAESWECEKAILSAIPKESADALKEYVRGKCMEVAQSVFRKKWNRELSIFLHEDELAAIVNSILEGKS
jgi:hypothetical protein